MLLAVSAAKISAAEPKVPVIHEPWIQIAGDPDLGELTRRDRQQPVDFGIWQANDGTWQLWSCIRKTKEQGKTRLFYRWESASLTDANWTPMGIAMRADPTVGEMVGGLPAPYVFRHDNQFVMFYGCWTDICFAISVDGKSFQRRIQENGTSTLFRDHDGLINPRDPMLIQIEGVWHCYYTAHSKSKGWVFCRRSTDLVNWSDECVVAYGGEASGNHSVSSECPFVVEVTPGHFYLFRTQKYGKDLVTCVYHSTNPLNFGIDNDEDHFIAKLPVAAPEIIRDDGKFYIASTMPSLKGIYLAPLVWEDVRADRTGP